MAQSAGVFGAGSETAFVGPKSHYPIAASSPRAHAPGSAASFPSLSKLLHPDYTRPGRPLDCGEQISTSAAGYLTLSDPNQRPGLTTSLQVVASPSRLVGGSRESSRCAGPSRRRSWFALVSAGGALLAEPGDLAFSWPGAGAWSWFTPPCRLGLGGPECGADCPSANRRQSGMDRPLPSRHTPSTEIPFAGP